jgi:hypothetical protein
MIFWRRNEVHFILWTPRSQCHAIDDLNKSILYRRPEISSKLFGVGLFQPCSSLVFHVCLPVSFKLAQIIFLM